MLMCPCKETHAETISIVVIVRGGLLGIKLEKFIKFMKQVKKSSRAIFPFSSFRKRHSISPGRRSIPIAFLGAQSRLLQNSES